MPSPEMQAALIGCFRQFTTYLGQDKLLVDDGAVAQADLGWLRATF